MRSDIKPPNFTNELSTEEHDASPPLSRVHRHPPRHHEVRPCLRPEVRARVPQRAAPRRIALQQVPLQGAPGRRFLSHRHHVLAMESRGIYFASLMTFIFMLGYPKTY